MAEVTSNYNLKKPSDDDFYNVQDFNDNADIVDCELKNQSDRMASIENPNFVEADNDNNIQSKESFVGILGKIKRAITRLTDHINSSNPHSGSAPKTHKHSTDDIESGTLPLSRGGTGANTAAEALKKLGITVTASVINLLNGLNESIIDVLAKKSDTDHEHTASEITSGTFSVSRIPNLDISKINDLQNSLNAKQNTLTSVRQGGKFYHKAGHEIYLDWTDEFIGLQVDDSCRGYLLATGAGKDKYSINQIDGLQTVLNKKASSSHSHNVSDIEDPDFVFLNTFVGDVAPYGSNLTQRPQIGKLSDRVEIKGYITFSFTKADASTQLDLLTLPSGYKAPKKNTFAVVPCDGYKVARIYMSPSGKLILDYVFDLKTGKNNDGNVEWLQIDMSWPINSLPKG